MAKANDTIKLSEGYKLVPEGENIVLTIEKFEGKPKANPSVIQVIFAHESGAKLKNDYVLKREGALGAFSALARAVLGSDITDFSISKDSKKMVGAKILCTVEHSEYNGNTYANVRKTSHYSEDELTEDETSEDEDDLTEDDDLSGGDDLDDDEEDDL